MVGNHEDIISFQRFKDNSVIITCTLCSLARIRVRRLPGVWTALPDGDDLMAPVPHLQDTEVLTRQTAGHAPRPRLPGLSLHHQVLEAGDLYRGVDMDQLLLTSPRGRVTRSIGHHCLVITRVDGDCDELTAGHLDRDRVPVVPGQQDVALAGLDLLGRRVRGGQLCQRVH